MNKIKPLIQIRSAVKCCIATERDELVCGKLIHSAKEVQKVGNRILGNKLGLTSDLCSADSAHVYNEAWKRDGLEDDGLEAAEIFNLTHRTALVFANADQRGSIGTPPTVELACNGRDECLQGSKEDSLLTKWIVRGQTCQCDLLHWFV